jgi:F0F1-type ATP synthase alpha subunit
LPVADTALGDISGYIHTNLMAITDGHLFFDHELFNAGQRPAVNPFLSVTRVGRQTQSSLAQEISSRLTRFLVQVREIQELAHFGSGLSESNQKVLNMGKKIYTLLDQAETHVVHVNLGYVLFAGIWGNVWADKSLEELRGIKAHAVKRYTDEPSFKTEIDGIVSQSKSLNELIVKLVQSAKLFQ